jgi:hypothetical protein
MGGSNVNGKHSWQGIQAAIATLQAGIELKETIPMRFKSSQELLHEINNDLYVQADRITAMMKDIICNGSDEDDIPF